MWVKLSGNVYHVRIVMLLTRTLTNCRHVRKSIGLREDIPIQRSLSV